MATQIQYPLITDSVAVGLHTAPADEAVGSMSNRRLQLFRAASIGASRPTCCPGTDATLSRSPFSVRVGTDDSLALTIASYVEVGGNVTVPIGWARAQSTASHVARDFQLQSRPVQSYSETELEDRHRTCHRTCHLMHLELSSTRSHVVSPTHPSERMPTHELALLGGSRADTEII